MPLILKRFIRIFIIVTFLNILVIGVLHLRDHPQSPDYKRMILADIGTRPFNNRAINVEGVDNFRDLGGYENKNGRIIKRGLIYRSGHLANITDSGLHAISEMGIRYIYDMRTKSEIEKAPDRYPPTVEYIHYPIYTETEEPGGFWLALTRYRLQEYWDNFNIISLAENKAERYSSLFTEISQLPNEPTVLHCTAGKDRVGIASVLFLSLLGVPEDIIIQDYTISNYYFPLLVEHAQSRYDEHHFFTSLLNMEAIDLYPFYLAKGDTIKKLFDYVEANYGTVEDLLIIKGGMKKESIAALRKKYLNK